MHTTELELFANCQWVRVITLLGIVSLLSSDDELLSQTIIDSCQHAPTRPPCSQFQSPNAPLGAVGPVLSNTCRLWPTSWKLTTSWPQADQRSRQAPRGESHLLRPTTRPGNESALIPRCVCVTSAFEWMRVNYLIEWSTRGSECGILLQQPIRVTPSECSTRSNAIPCVYKQMNSCL